MENCIVFRGHDCTKCYFFGETLNSFESLAVQFNLSELFEIVEDQLKYVFFLDYFDHN